MKKIFDLRFIIGLFFGVVGIILIITSLTMQTGGEKSETTNFWSGIFYVVFSVVMLILWKTGYREESEDADEISTTE